MARIKNNITKSGASLINERTRFYREQNRPVRQAYIPNGYNTDNLNIDMAFNDENTINFDNLKYSSFKKYFNVYPNERNTISEQQATPSTFPDLGINDLGITFENFEGSDDFYNNQAELLEKFLKKVNPVEVKFSAFNDNEFISNTIDNQDFIKGEGKYDFLDTNLYEETSIDIELDVPVNSLLEYSAKMQEFDATSAQEFTFTNWADSPYAFRQSTELHPRTNSPFLMYNFSQNCFEARGWSRVIGQNNEGLIYEGNEIRQIPNLNFTVSPITQNIQIVDNPNQQPTYTWGSFKNNLNFNLKHHNFALTNTPINDLNIYGYSFPINATETNGILILNNSNYLSVPTMQFGFPHFPVFHTFNDNLLSMKKYLNKPFIVDRVTVELGVKLKSEISTVQSSEDLYIENGLNFSLNYFILNTPKNFKQFKRQVLIAKPFNLNRNIFAVNSNTHESESFNDQISSTYSSKDIANIIGNFQNTKIFRKFFNINNSNDTSELNEFEFDFNKNIVTFGNIVFHAPNKNNLQAEKVYTPSHLTELAQLKNNNDLLIDTFQINDLNKSNLSDDFIYLDFNNTIKLNDYIKKSAYTGLQFACHNINHQLEFKTNLTSTLQAKVEVNDDDDPPTIVYNINNTNALNRNMLNERLDGKDVINSFSLLENEKTALIRKSSKEFLFNNTGLSSGNLNNYYTNFISTYETNFHKKPIQQFSPYVLTPNDNLAFCFSISPTITPKLFKHACEIKAGKVKFTLHGYMKKNNKIFQDDTNLKNLNQQNLTTAILGNNSIVIDDYENLGYLPEYINTFNDRIFQGTFNDDVNPRKLNETTETSSSKILSGKSYIPYLRLENILSEIAFDSEDGFIYDDFRTHTVIFDKMFAKSTQISNFNFYEAYKIAKELTFYKDKFSENDFDSQVGVEFNKINSTDEIPNIQPAITYKDKFDEILNFFLADAVGYESVVAYGLALIAFFAFIGAVANTQVARQGFKKYLNRFVKLRNYGQFRDNFEQRLYTSLMKSDVIDNIKYVAEQKFINDTTGEELTNLSNPLIPRNKSKYLQLIDAGFKSITPDGVITPWDGIDFYARKHVVYNDDLTPIFA